VLDDGGGGGKTYNPYYEQTNVNTNQPWVGDGLPVDIDLDGMTEYAEQMEAASRDVITRFGNLMPLAQMPFNAWDGETLGEAKHFRDQFQLNAQELFQYLRNLSTALLNVGMAAQTVADAYGNSDGWSAADLDAVMFAFGMPGAARPEGLHPMVGNETYWGQQFKQQEEGTAPIDPGSTEWGEETTSTWPYGSVTTATHPNGQTREILIESVGGGTLTTTTVYARDGSIVTQTSQMVSREYVGNSTRTTTTNYDRDNNVTGRTEQNSTYNDDGDVTRASTSTYDGSGNLANTVTTSTGSDGSQTTRTTNAEGEVTNESATGANTEGSVGVPDSPAFEEIERIQESYG
jgi:hypothetical protein